MTGPARRYLDAVRQCLDLGPESTYEVMSELENHFIEEAAHNPTDPEAVAVQRVISRLGSPRRLAARLNRSPRDLKRGDPIFISIPLAFGLYRRWRQAMADIPGAGIQILLMLTGLALETRLLLPFSWYWPALFGLVVFYVSLRWLILWVFDHLTREEVESVSTVLLGVVIAGYIGVGFVLVSWLRVVDARISVGVLVVVPLVAALLALRLVYAKRWRPKPWTPSESTSGVLRPGAEQ